MASGTDEDANDIVDNIITSLDATPNPDDSQKLNVSVKVINDISLGDISDSDGETVKSIVKKMILDILTADGNNPGLRENDISNGSVIVRATINIPSESKKSNIIQSKSNKPVYLANRNSVFAMNKKLASRVGPNANKNNVLSYIKQKVYRSSIHN